MVPLRYPLWRCEGAEGQRRGGSCRAWWFGRETCFKGRVPCRFRPRSGKQEGRREGGREAGRCSLVGVDSRVRDALFIIRLAAVGTPAREVIFSGILHDVVPAPKAHGVPAGAQSRRLVCDVQVLHAQRAQLLVLVVCHCERLSTGQFEFVPE